MIKRSFIGILFFSLTLYACGNNTMGSEEDFVGAWVLVDAVANDDLVNEALDGIVNSRIGLNFHADGTWSDRGDTGIWSIQGDKLTMTTESGITLMWTYEIDGDRLTLSQPKTDFLNFLRYSGASSSEMDFYREYLSSDFIFELVFRRT